MAYWNYLLSNSYSCSDDDDRYGNPDGTLNSYGRYGRQGKVDV
jgi:hypothetical protein